MNRYTVEYDAGHADGLPGFIVVDTLTHTIVEKCQDDQDRAVELCDYHNDMESGAFFEWDGQPTEQEEWADFDPDC